MGIRHQFWVIAKVGSRYRTLAVTHCQNATGTDATSACWRLLNIFGSSTNKTLIHHDLEYASTKTEDWWKSIAERNHDKLAIEKRIPFPFIHTCLALGTSYDSHLDKPFPFFFPVSAYEPGISPMNLLWNNQSGFTIVDITDQNHLCYCFMFPPRPPPIYTEDEPMEDKSMDNEPIKPPRCRLLTVEEYLSSGHVEENDLYVDLSQWSLITSDTLRELWPEVKWPDQEGGILSDEQTGHCGKNATVQSLRDLTFRAVFKEALDNIGMEEALKLPEHFIDFPHHLRQLLYESPESVKRPCGIALLGRAVKKDRALDFSPFPWLEEGEILQVVKGNTNLQEVKSIDLSCNSNVSVATVENLIDLCPNITTLIVVQTSNLPFVALSKALTGKKEIELFHSELFRAAFDIPRDRRISPFDSPLATLPNHTAPAGTLSQIAFFSVNRDIQTNSPLRLNGGGLKWSELSRGWFDVPPPQRGCDLFGTTIPLCDAFLNPSRLRTWFSQLLCFFTTNGATNDVRMWRPGHTSMGCACALAMNVKASTIHSYPHNPILKQPSGAFRTLIS